MSADILMLNPMSPPIMEDLEANFTVHKLYEAADEDRMLAEVGDKIRGVTTNGHAGAPPHILDKLPNLEIVSSFGVGYDAIDTDDCKRRGIRVTNTPGVLDDAVAEVTMGLLLAMVREIVAADVYVRRGDWLKATYPLTGELTGKTVGILGLGRIGKEIANRAQAFKMQVVYHGRSEQKHVPYPYFADLTKMAEYADYLVVIVPGTGTDKIVNREVMNALGPEGGLVSIGRGNTVDEVEMVAALKEGRLGMAALDVFVDEPNVPAELLEMSNVVLSPHNGSATHKTRWAMGDLVVRNLKAHFAGLPAITPVV